MSEQKTNNNYEPVNVDLKKIAKKLAVGGLIFASGVCANDIKTYSTYEVVDGKGVNLVHTEGAGKSALCLGTAAFVLLGVTKEERKKNSAKIMNFVNRFTRED